MGSKRPSSRARGSRSKSQSLCLFTSTRPLRGNLRNFPQKPAEHRRTHGENCKEASKNTSERQISSESLKEGFITISGLGTRFLFQVEVCSAPLPKLANLGTFFSNKDLQILIPLGASSTGEKGNDQHPDHDQAKATTPHPDLRDRANRDTRGTSGSNRKRTATPTTGHVSCKAPRTAHKLSNQPPTHKV